MFDSYYMFTKDVKGIKVKYIGKPLEDQKRKAIWVTKGLVTNL